MLRSSTFVFFAAAAVAVVSAANATGAGAALGPGDTCHVRKLDASRAYSACRIRAYTVSIKKGTPLDFSRCETSFTNKWTKAELIGGPACPTLGDGPDLQNEITGDVDIIASLLEDGTLPQCGDGIINGREYCDGADVGGLTCASYGYTSGTLACDASCLHHDVSGCSGRQFYPATGQTVSYPADLFFTSGQSVDDDGAVQSGAPLNFVDNGDGTITDLNTGLMWEKKANDGDIHDVDRTYFWSKAGAYTVWDWLELVNTEGGSGFAGHNDWRLPNRRELDSLVDFSHDTPSVSPAFDSSCIEGCTVTACSCTALADYWSSTTSAANTTLAWAVEFARGAADNRGKGTARAVRAVRKP